MKKLLIAALFSCVGTLLPAQVRILAELPGYGMAYTIESPQNRIYQSIQTIDLGHVGFSIDRVSLMAGAKVSLFTNDLSYHQRYFEEVKRQVPNLLYSIPEETMTYGYLAAQLQVRYALRKSFLGPIEIGFKYTWRQSGFEYMQALEPQGFGSDPITGHNTVQSFRRYMLNGSYSPVTVPSLSLRKYLNSNRIQFFVEPYMGISRFSVMTSDVDLGTRGFIDEQIHARPIVPEVGIKIAARWRREVHWFDSLKGLFEPIEE